MSHLLESVKEKAHELATSIKESELGTSVAKLTGTYDPLTMSAPTKDEKAMSGTHSSGHGGSDTVSSLPSMATQSLSVHGKNVATSSTGCPFADITHSLNIGGYVLASDRMLMEKQQSFNRSKIVERMVHPCGAGVIGHFEVTHDVTDLTCASFLNKIGQKTPVFGRFSTTTFGREFPDQGRNPRGFALKFYTDDGNYDMVGLHFPIFFVRDPSLGPDLIRSQQRNPSNFLLDLDAMFDFLAGVPESLHCGTMMFSDYGTPVGFRQMNAYGCHTFKWVTHNGKETFVKYHFMSENGIANFSWPEAIKVCGEDPDFAKRDLYSHIEKGGRACWRFCVQTMTHDQIDALDFDPFDVTKVWPHGQFPLRDVGRLVFDRNPESYHRDVEQVAFSPGSLVRGIELSPDALLQWRSFFYRDTQYYRLGVNLHQIPVNCPLRAINVHPITRDGKLRSDSNGVGDPQYAMNYRNAPLIGDNAYHARDVAMHGYITRGRAYKGKAATRALPTMATSSGTANDNDNMVSAERFDLDPDEEYRQVRQLYRHVMNDKQRDHLHFNIADQLKLCRPEVRQRFLAAIYKIDPEYAAGVVTKMELSTNGSLRMDMKDIARDAASMPCHRPYDGCPVAPKSHDRVGTTPATAARTTAAVAATTGTVTPTSHASDVLATKEGQAQPSSSSQTAPIIDSGTRSDSGIRTGTGTGTGIGVTQPLLSLPRHTYEKSTSTPVGDTATTTTTTPSEKTIIDDSHSRGATSEDSRKEKPQSISGGLAAAVSGAATGVIAAGQRLLGREPSTTTTTGGSSTPPTGSAESKYTTPSASGEIRRTGGGMIGGGQLMAYPQIHKQHGGDGDGHVHYPRELRGDDRIKSGHISYDPYGGDDERQEAIEPKSHQASSMGISQKPLHALQSQGLPQQSQQPIQQRLSQQQQQAYQPQRQQPSHQPQYQYDDNRAYGGGGGGMVSGDKGARGYGDQQYGQQSQVQASQHKRHEPLYEPYSSSGTTSGAYGYSGQQPPQQQKSYQQQQQQQQQQQRGYDASPPRKELGTGVYGKQPQYGTPLQQQPQQIYQQQQQVAQPHASQVSRGDTGGKVASSVPYQQGQGQGQGGFQQSRQLPSFEAPSSSSSASSSSSYGYGYGYEGQPRGQYQPQQQRRSDIGSDRDEYQYGYQSKPLSPYSEPHEYRVSGGGSYTIGGVPALPSFTPAAGARDVSSYDGAYDDRARAYHRRPMYGGYGGVSLPSSQSSQPSSYVSSIGSLLGLSSWRAPLSQASQSSMYRGPYYNDGNGASSAERASNTLQHHYSSSHEHEHDYDNDGHMHGDRYGSYGGYARDRTPGHGTGGGNYASYRGYQQPQPHHLRFGGY